MPKISNHESADRSKILLCGESGSGKTARIASLANCGDFDRVVVHDFDSGADVLRQMTTSQGADRLFYIPYQDNFSKTNGKLTPEAWGEFTKNLQNGYEDADGKLPSIFQMTPRDVLVVDTITFAGEKAKTAVAATSSREISPNYDMNQMQWYNSVRWLDFIIKAIMSNKVNTNVIITCHLRSLDENSPKLWPFVITKDYSRQFGANFNNVWRLDSKVISSTEIKRTIRTMADSIMPSLKNSAPSKISPVEEIGPENDLAHLMRKLRS